MGARLNVEMATLAVSCAFASFSLRVLGIGVFQAPSMHCPSTLADVFWARVLLGFVAVGLAGASLVLEGLRRRRGERASEAERALVALAVGGPAIAALAIALFALRPTVCF